MRSEARDGARWRAGHEDAFAIAFGNFKRGYLIADRVGLRITRDEITKTGFVKFALRKRVGGCILNDDALKLVKFGLT